MCVLNKQYASMQQHILSTHIPIIQIHIHISTMRVSYGVSLWIQSLIYFSFLQSLSWIIYIYNNNEKTQFYLKINGFCFYTKISNLLLHKIAHYTIFVSYFWQNLYQSKLTYSFQWQTKQDQYLVILSCKSHNAWDKYITMHHFVTEMCSRVQREIQD